MPYYAGSSRIDNAVKSWPKDILLLALTDEGTKVPDGYESFFTPDNAKVRGLSDKTKPITKDLHNKLLEYYPDEDFYGYINSDVILPLNVDVQSLLPGYDRQVALHHRLDVHDATNSTDSTTYYCSGKDCFIVNEDGLSLNRSCKKTSFVYWCMIS